MKRVLIANRGEIAVRIARTLRELGLEAVAVHTAEDRLALHVRSADRALELESARGYLNAEELISLARSAGVDAIHPGYGFLSENAEFAAACATAGLTFIGPPAAAIAAMGSKQRARAAMAAAGVPITPGGDARSLDEAKATAARVGYPVLIKATDGGGGKGMRLVETEAELESALERTRSEAQNAFGSDAVYLEKAITDARHVELQVLGDQHGKIVHLFERDCSIQRRHQKIVEETPCPVLTPQTLAKMGEVAIRGAASIGYFSAGTFEFLLAPDGSFYFLEMNTRLQVEHPITELVTGLDLVRAMISVARGDKLELDQPVRRGAAIEVRIYAEDPASGFLPSPGKITLLRPASGPFVRDDSGVYEGAEVSASYDPLLAKLSVWAENREHALARMRRALQDYAIGGIRTNLAFLARVIADPDFARGDYDIDFVGRKLDALLAEPNADAESRVLLAAASAVAAQIEAEKSTSCEPLQQALSPWVSAQRSALKS
ncbi:MAG TPA: biotin carboxylase N-terminal domain-containing protein [Polyangiaceae bacterium]|jgi:acetyl-CoA carboxylase biotin carboxylase subunit|nr:biotin carboxylase N-terminal domain-containing protein [Polyangiaceae bacterium]